MYYFCTVIVIDPVSSKKQKKALIHLGQVLALNELEDVPEDLLVILVPSVIITDGVNPDSFPIT